MDIRTKLKNNTIDWFDLDENQRRDIRKWFRREFMSNNRWRKKAILDFIHGDDNLTESLKNLFELAYDSDIKSNKSFIDYCNTHIDHSDINYQVEMTSDFYKSFIKYLNEAKSRGDIKSSNLNLALCIRQFCDAPKNLSVGRIRDLLSKKKL